MFVLEASAALVAPRGAESPFCD